MKPGATRLNRHLRPTLLFDLVIGLLMMPAGLLVILVVFIATSKVGSLLGLSHGSIAGSSWVISCIACSIFGFAYRDISEAVIRRLLERYDEKSLLRHPLWGNLFTEMEPDT